LIHFNKQKKKKILNTKILINNKKKVKYNGGGFGDLEDTSVSI